MRRVDWEPGFAAEPVNWRSVAPPRKRCSLRIFSPLSDPLFVNLETGVLEKLQEFRSCRSYRIEKPEFASGPLIAETAVFPEIERILFVFADHRFPGNLAQARSLGASVSGLLSPDFSFLIGSQPKASENKGPGARFRFFNSVTPELLQLL
jgi:hypothetical protein